MGCCNERGVLRPLLSGSGTSRSSSSSANNNNPNNASNSKKNSHFGKFAKKRFGKGGRNKINRISHEFQLRGVVTGVTSGSGSSADNNDYDHDSYEEFTDDDEDVILGYNSSQSYYCCVGNLCPIMLEMGRKIGLLIWKNLLLRRRHYVVTALEIILPTLCAMILVSF